MHAFEKKPYFLDFIYKEWGKEDYIAAVVWAF